MAETNSQFADRQGNPEEQNPLTLETIKANPEILDGKSVDVVRTALLNQGLIQKSLSDRSERVEIEILFTVPTGKDQIGVAHLSLSKNEFDLKVFMKEPSEGNAPKKAEEISRMREANPGHIVFTDAASPLIQQAKNHAEFSKPLHYVRKKIQDVIG